MKLVFLLLFLSLTGNDPSDNGIPYRNLNWSDFRAAVPQNEPTVAARTTTQIVMETSETNGLFHFAVKAFFLPDSSFVRIRSTTTLSHEQTHFKIAYIEAMRCMLELAPLQKGDSIAKRMAETLFLNYVTQSEVRNAQFDQETNHSLIVEAEQAWEVRISTELRIFENLSNKSHGRHR